MMMCRPIKKLMCYEHISFHLDSVYPPRLNVLTGADPPLLLPLLREEPLLLLLLLLPTLLNEREGEDDLLSPKLPNLVFLCEGL